jgi:4-deoxy-L-threo-5-hexosulose-uronate ketol-isomerase
VNNIKYPDNFFPTSETIEKTATQRRHTLRVIVPLKNGLIRKVEAFDARPTLNKVANIVSSKNSSLLFLRLTRVLLDPTKSDYKPIRRTLKNEEAIFYVNRGEAQISIDNQLFTLQKGDVIYVGINEKVTISSQKDCDVSEFRAIDCNHKYPIQLVQHKDIEGTPLAANLGTKRPQSRRTVYKLIDGSNIEACRLLFGDTYMANAGGVGSYPPHFHGPDGPHGLGDRAKEEIYHFRCFSDIVGDIPYVLQNCALPEEKINVYTHVFDDIAVNVTPTYHDTIAPPSVTFMFTWCLASFTENHRDWSEIFNKPGFEQEW